MHAHGRDLCHARDNDRDPALLLVADHPELKTTIHALLDAQYQIEEAPECGRALALAERGEYDCVVVDLQLAGGDPLAVVRELRRVSRETNIVVLCTSVKISLALEAVRMGATDFVIKEVEIGNLVERIRKVAGGPKDQERRPAAPPPPSEQAAPCSPMVVGKSTHMQEVMRILRRAAATPVPMLLVGESGTGKEMVARTIHQLSDRADGPFVAVNLAAIPADLVESTLFGHEKGAFTGATAQRTGKFGQARGGTLLLDEITELKPELQPKLLRVLQENEYERVGGDRTLRNEARIIAATNRDVQDAVANGSLRNDLFHRLNVITVRLPPLRERTMDIPELTDLFLTKYNRLYGRAIRGICSEAMETLTEYSWPGNIRELENVIQRAIIVAEGDYATERDLFDQEEVAKKEELVDNLAERTGTLEDLERQYVAEILRRTGGHQGQAASILGIDRKTLYNKILKFGLGRSLDETKDGGTEIGKNFQGSGKTPGQSICS